ncbi:MAG: polysaccharide deacetylase family protein [Paludibacteraceae bacterium]|nr:polysaccharide deacetylase family protein [Paludibacteraceae bacterium]MBP5480582.1 polysaccharide deacetylase family protein [Paludibacteraceae bacterium]
MRETIEYIIRFLLHGNDDLLCRVGYTRDTALFSQYDVVILPSPFFDDEVYGTPQSEPVLPLPTIGDTPILFGSSTTEQVGSTKVVHADLVAGAYFLISRYEEYLHPDRHRDAHGRFLGKESLPYRAGFLLRPILDEYSHLLLTWLSESATVSFPSSGYEQIYLTHDIDRIAYYRNPRGFLGGIKRNLTSFPGLKKVLKAPLRLENDPAYTFPWIIEMDRKVKGAQSVYFVKSDIHQHANDLPSYSLAGKDFKRLFSLLKTNNVRFGLHTSYYAGEHPEIISQEKEQLERSLNLPISFNRWHFLRSLQPADFNALINAGVSDDFTLGYADTVGFRLGTSRCVRWIDPKSRKVTSLRLHPLVAMDCSLSNSYYMNLTEDEAKKTLLSLLSQIRKHHGEVVLLWHNTVFSSVEGGYHPSLYQTIIEELNK